MYRGESESFRARVSFHPICIGKRPMTSTAAPQRFQQLPDVMASLNHTAITLLKVRRREGRKEGLAGACLSMLLFHT